jgi:hypothetical protein
MEELFKITELKSFTVTRVDSVHKVDLSCNSNKTEWFVTIKGDFYTEFTFKIFDAANDMYLLCIGATNIFMDSLGTTKNEMSDAEISAYEEGR